MKKNQIKTKYLDIDSKGNILILSPLEPLLYINASKYRAEIDDLKISETFSEIHLDFGNQISFDTYLVVFSDIIKSLCINNKVKFLIVNSNDRIESVLNLLKSTLESIPDKREKKSWIYDKLVKLGNIWVKLYNDIHNFISFFGEVFLKFITLLIHPSRMRWKDLPLHFTQAGVMALPITLLIVFLLGLITGYQGALQLKQFGADIFIADLIGISLSRELSPLMVAILVAGRSGSAFAAEIGTMKVSEEIDALTTMGFDRIEFLVLPRIFAVTLAMPILVIICNIVGMFGGLIAAITTLDITSTGYILRMQSALSLWDIGSGLFKSLIFGFLIASLGCYKGLNVEGGADSVGRFTTSSVVAGVFLIILTDAIFTFIFQSLGV